MKKVVVGASVVLAVILITIVFLSGQSDKKDTTNNVSSNSIALRDAHGLAVDRKDSSKVYIATHTGLLQMTNVGDFQSVGSAQDDYMGFSAHPTDASVFYTSGHPRGGGNIGFQKSTDGGKTWQKVSDGIGGPVDFHTMAVSQVDPNVIYGVYRGQLQRSKDEGRNWELVNVANIGNIITLTTDAVNKDMVYAGTMNGLYASQNGGNEWYKVNNINSAVTSVVVTGDGKAMIAYADGKGLLKSNDGGITWTELKNYMGDAVIQLAKDKQNPLTAYLISQSLEIHKSTDNGETWNKIR